MPTSRDGIYEAYKAQPFIGGGLYACYTCSKQLAGGRHLMRLPKDEIVSICPTCWPSVLERLKSVFDEEEKGGRS